VSAHVRIGRPPAERPAAWQALIDQEDIRTVQALARLLGCCYVSLSRWIHGHTMPSPSFRVRVNNLARARGLETPY
jgi:hypothetical protein